MVAGDDDDDLGRVPAVVARHLLCAQAAAASGLTCRCRRGAEERPVARRGVGVRELRDSSTVHEHVGAQASRVDGHFLSSHVLV